MAKTYETSSYGYNWTLNLAGEDRWSDGQITVALLADIRRELQRLNGLLNCPNAIDIPNILRRIDTNTKKPARKKKK